MFISDVSDTVKQIHINPHLLPDQLIAEIITKLFMNGTGTTTLAEWCKCTEREIEEILRLGLKET